MAEPEAGSVTTEQAILLLLLDKAADLKALEREGAFKQIAPGRYWIKDLVQGYIRFTRDRSRDVNTETLCSVFGVVNQRISQLANAGWFRPLPRTKKGIYNWMEACAGYIKFLRDEDRRSSKHAADSRMRDAKAYDIEVRTRQRLGRLVPLEAYEEMIDNTAGMVRTEFAGMAAACTRDLVLRRIIEREVNARLQRIAEFAMAQAIRLETVRGTADAERADGAGSVGGGKPDLPTNGGGAGSA